jgi:hypothetical protein
VIENEALFFPELINEFEHTNAQLRQGKPWNKYNCRTIFIILPAFGHKKTVKYFDNKMRQ